jgi:hypothetical protein
MKRAQLSVFSLVVLLLVAAPEVRGAKAGTEMHTGGQDPIPTPIPCPSDDDPGCRLSMVFEPCPPPLHRVPQGGVITVLSSVQELSPGLTVATVAPAALCFCSSQPVGLGSELWHVTVRLDPAAVQPEGVVNLFTAADPTKSSFTMTLRLALEVTYENLDTGETLVRTRRVDLTGTGPWVENPPGGFLDPDGVEVDTDCDGLADSVAPPTSSLGLSWGFDGGAWVPVETCLTDLVEGDQLCILPVTG